MRSSIQLTWCSLFRHEVLSKDPVVGQMAIKYLGVARINLVKVGLMYSCTTTSCYFHANALSTIYRLDFLQKMIVEATNSPGWTLIVMKILIPTLIVS